MRQWTVSANPNLANTTSTVLMRINHPQPNHQGGSMRFGPDGNLYIGLGDGGGANDNSGGATSTTDGHTNSVGNGQDTTVPFGKILRIDVSGNVANPLSSNGKYRIPVSNPFASGAGGNLKEIYSYGMRNPYKMNFDTGFAGSTDKLYVGDVGQGQREEVDTILNGHNYGWPFREGTRDNSADAGRTTPTGFASDAPIAEYTHLDGDSIIGGYVYRGSAFPALYGKYVFGDYQGTTGTGRIFYTDAAGGPISEFNYDPSRPSITGSLIGFGSDINGGLYALFSNGNILTLTPEPASLSLLSLGAAGLLMRRNRRTLC